MKCCAALIVFVGLFAQGPAVCGQAKLEYRQREAVRRQVWTVKQIEGKGLTQYRDMAWLDKQVHTVADLNRYINDINNKWNKLNNVVNGLNRSGAPSNHPDVAPIFKRVDAARAILKGAMEKLQAAAKKSQTQGQASSYPNYKQDIERLKKLDERCMIADVQVQADQVIAIAPQMKRAIAYVAERKQFYAPFVAMGTGEARRMQRALHSAGRRLSTLNERCAQYSAQAPERIKRDLQSANRLIGEAVEKQKPAFLEGGVAQHLGFADKTLTIVEALHVGDVPGWATALRGQYQTSLEKVAALRKSMRKAIVAAQRTPQELYGGSDKEQLKKLILTAWKEAYPKDEILAVRASMRNWERSKKAHWSSASKSFDFTDKSYIQLSVIVKTSPDIATIYVAYVNKNHLNNAVTTGVGTKGSSYVVREMLVKNFK